MRGIIKNLMKLLELSETLAVCRLEAKSQIPDWAYNCPFFSITQTAQELSIVCSQSSVPQGVKAEKDWKAFQVAGVLDFALTGILSAIAAPLAEAKISIFAISTFDTDFVLVKNTDWLEAKKVLQKAGFFFE